MVVLQECLQVQSPEGQAGDTTEYRFGSQSLPTGLPLLKSGEPSLNPRILSRETFPNFDMQEEGKADPWVPLELLTSTCRH